MTNENRGTALCGERAFGYGDIIRQRRRWILDDRHVVAILLEMLVDALPARPVHESPCTSTTSSRLNCYLPLT